MYFSTMRFASAIAAILGFFSACASVETRPPDQVAPPLPAAGEEKVEETSLERKTLEDLMGHFVELGFTVRGPTSLWSVATNETRELDFEIEEGMCAVVAAAGSMGVERLTLRLYFEGHMLAADLHGRPYAALFHCAEQSQTIRAHVTVDKGAGDLAAGSLFAERATVSDIVGPPLRASALFFEPRRVVEKRASSACEEKETLKRTAVSALDSLIADAETAFCGVGMKPLDLISLKRTKGDAARGTVALSAGRCYGSAVVSTSPFESVEITDSSRAAVSSWRGDAPSAMLAFCVSRDDNFDVEVLGRQAADDERFHLAIFESKSNEPVFDAPEWGPDSLPW